MNEFGFFVTSVPLRYFVSGSGGPDAIGRIERSAVVRKESRVMSVDERARRIAIPAGFN